MVEKRDDGLERRLNLNHRGRGSQTMIYFGKLLRMFIYQSDWKVLPMSALIVGLVGMVIRKKFFVTMEMTMTGSFALVCMCIWNGCFNSIQVICRERDVIKREHRSGMHISSYILAHMMIQALVCLAQTVIAIYVLRLIGVRFPSEGLLFPIFFVDFGISLFLITYAADMLSLWLSAISRTTTTAMTVMPFVLIFQLVFSGGMLSLPEWAMPLTGFTVSNPGMKLVATQSDLNNLPFVTISDMLVKMRNNELEGTITLGEVLDRLQEEDDPVIADLRDQELEDGITVGNLVDMLALDPLVQVQRDQSVTLHATVGQLMDIVGQDKVTDYLNNSASATRYNPDYDHTIENMASYWLDLFGFVILFAFLAMMTLEFIDKDKR